MAQTNKYNTNTNKDEYMKIQENLENLNVLEKLYLFFELCV